MKAHGIKILGFSLLIAATAGAADYNKNLKKELDDVDEMYPAKTEPATAVAAPVQVQTKTVQVQTQQVQGANSVAVPAPAQAVQAPGPQPIYILQQPTTTVEAPTVQESKSEQLRKQREDVEHQNEQKLVERLEEERLKAEKERSEKILNALSSEDKKDKEAAAPVVVAPQAAVIPAVTTLTVQSEAKKDEEEISKAKIIAGLTGGIGNYPSLTNTNGAYAVGGNVEWRLPSRIGMGGSVSYSSYDITSVASIYPSPFPYSVNTVMNQWDVNGNLTFAVFKSALTPVAGVSLGYTRRDYSNRVTYGFNNQSYTGSNAFNGSILAGFEIRASDNLLVGGGIQYIMNISYRVDNQGFGGGYNINAPLEPVNYYLATLNTRILF